MNKVKITTYRRLKVENQILKEDIYKILEGTFLEKLEITAKYRMQFNLEKIIWGSHGK